MPKETSIPVSRKTLNFVKAYKKEFGFKSLDIAVENAVRWARLWSYVDSQQRRSMIERIGSLELQVQKLAKMVVALGILVNKKLGEKENV